jgi:GT2 family glycosyltransferase
MDKQRTIVLVLRSGGDFAFRDVELITRHIQGKWQSPVRPRIVCLWDNATERYDLGNIEIIPLTNNYKGTWSRMQLYSPEMEQYRPFLYVDLDTAVIKSLENIFRLVEDESQFIVLEDFWQKDQMATGLVWFPANSEKLKKVWEEWHASSKVQGFRMDNFLRKVIVPDKFWQQLTTTVYDFKPKTKLVLSAIPEDADLVCFHGRPRIFDAAESSLSLDWVRRYVKQTEFETEGTKRAVTVIIPYKVDRGWLKDAISSVPNNVQLLLSQGEGNWPQNFNKALNSAEGAYIKYLHDDDMLTPTCIQDSIRAIETQKVDFIHGNAVQLNMKSGTQGLWKPLITHPTLRTLVAKNTIHSATLMYKRSVFEKVGLFNESPKVQSFEEYEFNLRCLKAGLKIGYCPTTLAYYRRHPNQLIKTTSRLQRLKYRSEVVEQYKSN